MKINNFILNISTLILPADISLSVQTTFISRNVSL